MKKILTFGICALSLLGLAACSNSNNSKDLSANDAKIRDTWNMDSDTYFNTSLYKPESLEESYYLIDAPTDIKESLRVSFTNINDYKNEYEYYETSYLSTSSLSDTMKGYIIDALDSNLDMVKEKSELTNFDLPKTWSYKACTKDDVKDLANPEICVVYMPVTVTYHQISKKADEITLYAYAFVPLYTVVCSNDNGTYSNEFINSIKDKKIEIEMNGTVVA